MLVHVDFPAASQQQHAREDKDEFVELVRSAGIESLELVKGRRQRPDPKYFVGSGKVEELAECVRLHTAPLVLFNHALSPAQERNLERALECRVVDRTGLILDIFAQRAHTFEGKLQVELAQLKHLSTRLIRGWTHLERQKGGIGLRGPGETQLETDRRLLRGRVRWIQQRLARVDSQRQQGRRARRRAQLPTVALVGYTNAGKSTLFNHLTDSTVLVADQLFATLDPTLRKVQWAETGALILADTVGFIRHLPHDLVAAFRATLQETRDADVLLHIVDASDPRREENMKQVDEVLDIIGAHQLPLIKVYNKIDRIEGALPRLDGNPLAPAGVWLSARDGCGMELLRQVVAQRLGETPVECQLCLPPNLGKARAMLFAAAVVDDEIVLENGDRKLSVRMSNGEWERIGRKCTVDLSDYIE